MTDRFEPGPTTEHGRDLLLRLGVCLLPLALILLLAASPPNETGPEELIRLGNEAVHRGDLDAAERYYTQAAERSADPGLVAFNLATVAGLKGDAREAEVNYIRALDDREAPPARRARALYNRGVWLLTRGGSAAIYRTAVACFEQAIELSAADVYVERHAPHNLELAKVLWNRARAKEKSPQRPNDLPPDAPPEEPPPDVRQEPGANEPGGPEGPGPNRGTQPQVIPGAPGKDSHPRETPQRTPGAGTLPVILDPDRPEHLSSDEARAILKQAAARIEKDRKANIRLTTGPERPHVRDW